MMNTRPDEIGIQTNLVRSLLIHSGSLLIHSRLRNPLHHIAEILPRYFWAEIAQNSVNSSAEIPLCPYVVAYRRSYGLFTSWLSKNAFQARCVAWCSLVHGEGDAP